MHINKKCSNNCSHSKVFTQPKFSLTYSILYSSQKSFILQNFTKTFSFWNLISDEKKSIEPCCGISPLRNCHLSSQQFGKLGTRPRVDHFYTKTVSFFSFKANNLNRFLRPIRDNYVFKKYHFHKNLFTCVLKPIKLFQQSL